jgi:hypothetical protein
MMDGLIVIRSVTLSNHIMTTRFPEGVVVGCYRALRGRGRDNAITPKDETKAVKSRHWLRDLRALSTRLAFREH